MTTDMKRSAAGVSGTRSTDPRRNTSSFGDYEIVTTLRPGGKERMRRLMSMVQTKRFDPAPLLTHSFTLDQIVEAYDLFGSRRDGVLKVAIRPPRISGRHNSTMSF